MVRRSVFYCLALMGALFLGSGGATAQNTTQQIFLINQCSAPVRVAIHFHDGNGTWQTRYWYYMEPGEEYFPTTKGERLRHRARDKRLYIYAETRDGRGHFGKLRIPLGGLRFGMAGPIDFDYAENGIEVPVNCNMR